MHLQHFVVSVFVLLHFKVIVKTTICCVLLFVTTEEAYMKELNTILKDLREDRDIKQETLAKYLGVSQQTYSNYENGHREIPISVVTALASYYQVSTDYLLCSDSSYLGNVNMNAPYVDNITMHDIVYHIQALDDDSRKNLVKYIRFLHQSKD